MSDTDQPDKPKRRVRYKGTHPKKFNEKYKELNPQTYAEDVEHVKSRGGTPAGTHRPICVDEILQILKPKPGDSFLDATLGYGGHTTAIGEKIWPSGKLIALDQDPIEREKTEARLRAKGWGADFLTVGPINFSESKKFLQQIGTPKVDLIMADLGLSSMQIDNPERGFTLKTDAPLDLRMNPNVGIPASEFLKTVSEEKMIAILQENSDEIRSRQIARAILKHKPTTTLDLAKSVQEAMTSFSPKIRSTEGDQPIRRALQALRIEINQEFAVLDKFLADLPSLLKPGGRIAILSFHSGEDKRVKKSFQSHHRAGLYSEIADTLIRPSAEEQRSNPRSKPAKLRWAKG